MTQVMVRTALKGKPFEDSPYGWTQTAAWLELIWKVNEIEPGTFGAPKIGQWWAGGTVEEYPDARVIFVGDDTARVVSKTERGAWLIAEAAQQLGLNVTQTIQVIEKEEG